MNADSYSIAQLVADLKQACTRCNGERELLAAVRALARRAALASSTWIDERMYRADPEQGVGAHLLHEEPDHTLAVFAVSWLPHRGVPPHDHGTWAVVAGVDGPEKNEFFERVDDRGRRGHAELRKVGEKVCDLGDVVAMPNGMIHSVTNETESVTVSLHIYGKHINYTGRSQFDLKTSTETPFVLKIDNEGLAPMPVS